MLDVFIGIDPGETNGVAVYDRAQGLRLYSMTFWKLIEFIDGISARQREGKDIVPHFRVENPALNGFMYSKRINGKTAKVALSIAQNVGMNKQDAKRIIERIEAKGMILYQERPNPQSQKWTHEFLAQLCRGRFEIKSSNSHERDAAKLIAKYWLK